MASAMSADDAGVGNANAMPVDPGVGLKGDRQGGGRAGARAGAGQADDGRRAKVCCCCWVSGRSLEADDVWRLEEVDPTKALTGAWPEAWPGGKVGQRSEGRCRSGPGQGLEAKSGT